MARIIEINLDEVIRNAAEEGWTQSEITLMDNCAMKWYWRYGMRLNKPGKIDWPSIYGNGWHSTMEEMYATRGEAWEPAQLILPDGIIRDHEVQVDLLYWQGVLGVQTRCYAKEYKDDFTLFEVQKIEVEVDIIYQGIRLRGKIDLTFTTRDGKLWLLDHKTTSRLDLGTILGWDFRFQFMFYLWLAMKAVPDVKFTGYYINAIKKPTIRQKKGESLESFFVRLENEMLMEPNKYYYRDRLLLTNDSISYFEENVLTPKLNRIKLLTNPEVPDSIKLAIVKNLNTDFCQRFGTCEYLPLCQHGYAMEGFQYQQRSAKHTELEESPE